MPNIIFLVMRRMRVPLIVLISAYAFAMLGFVLIPGEDDQGRPWQMGFFHAFYFVSYMGSTIGFGEIPYAFTDAQRMWTIVSIYVTVVSWLYAIGALISLIQTSIFRSAVTRNGFILKVRRLQEPFYLICGYGDTGQQLVAGLSGYGIRCVVIDQEHDRITELELENLPLDVPALHANAAQTDTLLDAGLDSAYCNGVVAVTRDDQVNLKVAIAAKLLNGNIKVYCWAESHDTGVNMASFNTDHIIYPYDTFAEFLAIALHKPSNHLLRQWLSSPPGTPLTDPVFPPRGHWLLCGYGRFGKAIYQQLIGLGLEITVVEEFPAETLAPDGTITGRGTEAETLELANIREAVGIIAGTDHDVNNLSIILTARDICPELFTVARQELVSNERIFDAARIDLVFNHSRLISRQLLSLITAPLTSDFLRLSRNEDDAWSRHLVCRLLGCVDEENPVCWVTTLQPERIQPFMDRIDEGGVVELQHLIREPADRKRKMPCVPLLILRGKERLLLPDDKTVLKPYDRILLAGLPTVERRIKDILTSPELLHYMITGDRRAAGTIWRWFNRGIEITPGEKSRDDGEKGDRVA